uniref:Serpin domain-containing protein n=1 Tax=Seriola dumerili TaxID=41447 RepID=A0A3B4UV02_SERDU
GSLGVTSGRTPETNRLLIGCWFCGFLHSSLLPSIPAHLQRQTRDLPLGAALHLPQAPTPTPRARPQEPEPVPESTPKTPPRSLGLGGELSKANGRFALSLYKQLALSKTPTFAFTKLGACNQTLQQIMKKTSDQVHFSFANSTVVLQKKDETTELVSANRLFWDNPWFQRDLPEHQWRRFYGANRGAARQGSSHCRSCDRRHQLEPGRCFVADRPFLLLIQRIHHQHALFIGRVSTPCSQ